MGSSEQCARHSVQEPEPMQRRVVLQVMLVSRERPAVRPGTGEMPARALKEMSHHLAKLLCLTDNQTVACDLFLNKSFFHLQNRVFQKYIVIH